MRPPASWDSATVRPPGNAVKWQVSRGHVRRRQAGGFARALRDTTGRASIPFALRRFDDEDRPLGSSHRHRWPLHRPRDAEALRLVRRSRPRRRRGRVRLHGPPAGSPQRDRGRRIGDARRGRARARTRDAARRRCADRHHDHRDPHGAPQERPVVLERRLRVQPGADRRRGHARRGRPRPPLGRCAPRLEAARRALGPGRARPGAAGSVAALELAKREAAATPASAG